MTGKTIYIYLLALIGSISLIGQDARFSQFYASPQNLNPAMIGVFDGRMRLAANYRDQWASVLDNYPFHTYSIGAEFKYNISDDFLSFGINLIRDDASISRYHNNSATLGASYQKKLSQGGYHSASHFLVGAGQIGIGQFGVDFSNIWLPDQFNWSTETPDPDNIGTAEPQYNSNFYLDINAGLMWYAVFDNDKSMYLGGGMFHITEPNISFSGSSAILYSRWIVHGGGQFPITDEFSILPSFQVMTQGPSLETDIGSNFRYSNHDWYELAIRAGVWGRFVENFNDALSFESLIFSTVLEMERYNLGVSYDINTSSLKTASHSRGAVELSLIYTMGEKLKYKVECPKF